MIRFPKPYADVVARLRVPSGFLIVVVFAWFSHPTAFSLEIGLPVSLLGLALRAWAAGCLAKNQELHFTLYEAAGMPVAMQMIESLWLQAGPHLNLSIAEGGFTMGEDHHRELLEGLSRHDVKAARAAIEADISDAAIIIRKFLESRKVSAA